MYVLDCCYYCKGNNWTNHHNHKNFFDQLAKTMNISHPTDWYKVKREDIYNQGGQKLLQYYFANSLYKALSSCYPDKELFPWLFQEDVPPGFWKNINNHR